MLSWAIWLVMPYSAAASTGSLCGLAAYWSMGRSISGRKWAISPGIRQGAPNPPGAFPTGGGRAAAFGLVEIRQARNRANDVRRLVHHDRRRCAKARLELSERVEVHRTVHDLGRGNQSHRRSAGNDGEE